MLLIYSKYLVDHKWLLIIYYIFANIVNKKLSVCDYSIFLTYEFNKKDILGIIRKYNAQYKYFKTFDELTKVVAEKISEGNVIGWFQGRMEFGPRALGNRSILGDARNPEMQKKMNLKIKL